MIIKQKFKIQIPTNIDIFYESENNLLVIKKERLIKSITPVLKIVLFKTGQNNFIYVTDKFVNGISSSEIKMLNIIKGKLCSDIKKNILEINSSFSKKIKLVGVGFRAINEFPNSFTFKLGFSHPIFYKLPKGISSHCKKHTQITLFGKTSYYTLSKTTADIRALKKPEPYKGKGILYADERVIIKQGKKV